MSTTVHVEPSRCIRCGACRALSPGLFDLTGSVSRAVREPAPEERVFVQAARLICPMDAVVVEAGQHEEGVRQEAAPSFDELATSAESVRWSLGDVPWHEIDAKLAPPELRAMVREMAFSENATYSATQRFLESFYEDIEFSKWISVWFYEETRHPHVLVEWLARVGDPVSADFVATARVSTPFMRSIVGTLITNLISEITAAQAYRGLAAHSPEPVLATLARRIAGDEARHAATFFRFARRELARAPIGAAWRERARGLEVLQAWLGGARQTTHPVAQMVERLNDGANAVDIDFHSVRTRVVRTVALLLDVPLRREGDVEPALKALLAERRGS